MSKIQTITSQIADFHDKLAQQLGPAVVQPYAQSLKLAEEADELRAEITTGTEAEALGELADVVIVAMVMGHSMGVTPETLLDMVETKMRTNLARTWATGANGAAHHI